MADAKTGGVEDIRAVCVNPYCNNTATVEGHHGELKYCRRHAVKQILDYDFYNGHRRTNG